MEIIREKVREVEEATKEVADRLDSVTIAVKKLCLSLEEPHIEVNL